MEPEEMRLSLLSLFVIREKMLRVVPTNVCVNDIPAAKWNKGKERR